LDCDEDCLFRDLVAALCPQPCLGLFSFEPLVIETGAYRSIVGPAYRFCGLGMALYFASQALRDFYSRC